MQKTCEDNYSTTFMSFEDMQHYHEELTDHTRWYKCKVHDLHIEPLDTASPLYGDLSAFASGVSMEAVEDTTRNLGLAMQVEGEMYPIRMTAYKTLLDRAKIGGTVLPKLSRAKLARTLNDCLEIYGSEALVLIRNEKISATHSGDPTDYSVLPIDELLETICEKLDDRFPGNEFLSGYCDHAVTSASWTMPDQREELLGAYEKTLKAHGKRALTSKPIPGIRFITSDTGVASAKVSALLMGTPYSIHIGSCIAVDHRHQSTVNDFNDALSQLFAQFQDSVGKLQKLLDIQLEYPVNAMTRICKKLSMPKKAAVEAIQMYELTYGGGPATAHDVFMAMQEISYILRTEHAPESKLLALEENMARALTLRWSDYDLAKAVNY